MPTVKRFLNVKTITVIATVLFIVACYLTVKKLMALDIQLGMDRATVIKILGKPIEEPTMIQAEVWEKVLFSKNVYHQIILVDFNKSGKAIYITVIHEVFDRQFMERRR